MGGQFEYFGLWLDQDYGKGHSRAKPTCTTYDSPQLSGSENFVIDCLEVWAVGPLPKKKPEVSLQTVWRCRLCLGKGLIQHIILKCIAAMQTRVLTPIKWRSMLYDDHFVW